MLIGREVVEIIQDAFGEVCVFPFGAEPARGTVGVHFDVDRAVAKVNDEARVICVASVLKAVSGYQIIARQFDWTLNSVLFRQQIEIFAAQ